MIERFAVAVSVLAALMVCAVPGGSAAENIVFPPNSGIVDVTQAPYYADNSGNTDVTDILSRALQDERAQGGWRSRIVYLPNGTYLVADGISFTQSSSIGPHMQGQSREGTVIRLADGTWPTVDGLRFVLTTGNGVAQCFNRGVRNLTVNIGSNNRGASGIWWYGNNGALLSDVDVISEDGQGIIGLHGGTGESGPSGVRNLYVRGFDIGVQVGALNAVTFVNTTVEGQNLMGINVRTQNCPAWFDGVVSINRVSAFRSEGGSRAVLVDADFSGGADSCEAIWNYSGARLFARNVQATGYRGVMYCPSTIQTLDKIPQGMYIDEFSSHKDTSLFASSGRSLNLPRKLPPEPAWEQDMSKWAIVSEYTSGRSETEAFQAAIDDPSKTSVAIDMNLTFDGTVYVRNNVGFIIGTNSCFYNNGGGQIEVVDGAAPVVKIQNISHSYQEGDLVPIIQRSSRPLILESSSVNTVGDGSGDLFLTDVLRFLEITNPQQNVWAWHFNPEEFGIGMSAGTFRCFGWKTEHDGNKVTTTGGTLEILGFLVYAPCGEKVNPLLDISNTNFSLAMMNQFTFCDGALYEHLIQEEKDGTTRNLYAADNTLAYDLPLYLSHDRVSAGEIGQAQPTAGRRGAVRRKIVVDGLGIPRGTSPNGGVYDLRGKSVQLPTGRRGRALGGRVPRGVYVIGN